MKVRVGLSHTSSITMQYSVVVICWEEWHQEL